MGRKTIEKIKEKYIILDKLAMMKQTQNIYKANCTYRIIKGFILWGLAIVLGGAILFAIDTRNFNNGLIFIIGATIIASILSFINSEIRDVRISEATNIANNDVNIIIHSLMCQYYKNFDKFTDSKKEELVNTVLEFYDEESEEK